MARLTYDGYVLGARRCGICSPLNAKTLVTNVNDLIAFPEKLSVRTLNEMLRGRGVFRREPPTYWTYEEIPRSYSGVETL